MLGHLAVATYLEWRGWQGEVLRPPAAPRQGKKRKGREKKKEEKVNFSVRSCRCSSNPGGKWGEARRSGGVSELSRDCLSNPLAPTGPNPGAQPTPPAPRSGEAQSAFPPAPAKRSWVRALSLEGVGVGSPPARGIPPGPSPGPGPAGGAGGPGIRLLCPPAPRSRRRGWPGVSRLVVSPPPLSFEGLPGVVPR